MKTVEALHIGICTEAYMHRLNDGYYGDLWRFSLTNCCWEEVHFAGNPPCNRAAMGGTPPQPCMFLTR